MRGCACVYDAGDAGCGRGRGRPSQTTSMSSPLWFTCLLFSISSTSRRTKERADMSHDGDLRVLPDGVLSRRGRLDLFQVVRLPLRRLVQRRPRLRPDRRPRGVPRPFDLCQVSGREVALPVRRDRVAQRDDDGRVHRLRGERGGVRVGGGGHAEDVAPGPVVRTDEARRRAEGRDEDADVLDDVRVGPRLELEPRRPVVQPVHLVSRRLQGSRGKGTDEVNRHPAPKTPCPSPRKSSW